MSSRRLALATLFGSMISAFEIVLPSPIGHAFVLFQALLLSLGYLLLGAPGATYVSLVGGLLTALWRAPLALFTLTFALLYGLLIDAISSIINVRVNNDVKDKRLITSVTVSTVIVGSASYYTSVIFELLPRNPLLEIGILATGVINGLIGGYLSTVIWKRIFKQAK